jgi:hypothetical protein
MSDKLITHRHHPRRLWERLRDAHQLITALAPLVEATP